MNDLNLNKLKQFPAVERIASNNIVFTFDEQYNSIFHVVIASILHSADPKNIPDFNFLINYFGDLTLMRILEIETCSMFPGNKFTFTHVPTQFPEVTQFCDKMYDFEAAPEQIQTSSVFCRLFLPRMYPGIDLVLHIDLDIIVKSDLTELFDIVRDSERRYPLFSCLNECIYEASLGSRKIFAQKREELFHGFPWVEKNAKRIGLHHKLVKDYAAKGKKTRDTAFNAGILFFDLDFMRKKQYEPKFRFCMRLNSVNKIFRHNDQGILNFLFHDRVGKLPLEWNSMWFGCGGEMFERCVPQYETAKLLHYNGPLKPWSENKCRHSGAVRDWAFCRKLADQYKLEWLSAKYLK